MSATIRVKITDARGSTPREAGAIMYVFPGQIAGTIGGGALEWDAIRIARSMMDEGKRFLSHTVALGPDMGQCCGGAVTLEFSADMPAAEPDTATVMIWGAGHVGRAIAQTLSPLEPLTVTLIDDDASRLPKQRHTRTRPMIANDMPRAVRYTPSDAHHYILTYSHDIDLALCDALLRHGFSSCGLIGSATKWARFRKRLGQLGHTDAQISRIMCPIGDPSLGKHPQAIAIGVAARLIGGQMPQESAPETSGGT